MTLQKLNDEQLLEYYNKYQLLSKREIDVKINNYSTKFAYHVVRLLDEVEQIMMEGDIDLMKNREQLKSIRRGDWTVKDVEDYFASKEKQLEELYIKSSLPHKPDTSKIKQLLIDCLEEHYGDIGSITYKENNADQKLKEIRKIIDK